MKFTRLGSFFIRCKCVSVPSGFQWVIFQCSITGWNHPTDYSNTLPPVPSSASPSRAVKKGPLFSCVPPADLMHVGDLTPKKMARHCPKIDATTTFSHALKPMQKVHYGKQVVLYYFDSILHNDCGFLLRILYSFEIFPICHRLQHIHMKLYKCDRFVDIFDSLAI